MATRPEQALVNALVGRLLDDAGVAAPLDAPAGVEVTRREAAGRAYTFVLNHNDLPAHVALPAPMRDLLTGATHAGTLETPARGVSILTP